MYMQVQVVYRQGLVKTFLAPKEILMDDFMKYVRATGKIKTTRFMPDVGEAEAIQMVKSGEAVKVEVRREKE